VKAAIVGPGVIVGIAGGMGAAVATGIGDRDVTAAIGVAGAATVIAARVVTAAIAARGATGKAASVRVAEKAPRPSSRRRS